MIYINNLEITDFLKENPEIGILKIQAYTAYQAIPLKGVKVNITKEIKSQKEVFYRGETNDSGIIDNIKLPAPKYSTTNETAPSSIYYNIEAIHDVYNLAQKYTAEIFSGIKSIQYIKMTPNGGNSHE